MRHVVFPVSRQIAAYSQITTSHKGAALSTPGTRDLIRMGVIVVAGTALGVGAVSQWTPPQDAAWMSGPTLFRCTERISPEFFGVGGIKNSTNHNIQVTSVKTTGSNSDLRVARFYVVPSKKATSIALGGTHDPSQTYSPNSPNNHILVPSDFYQALMVDFSNDRINGHATQLQVTLKNDGATSTHTYPIDVVMGGPDYNQQGCMR